MAFPIPFAGCDHQIHFKSRPLMQRAVVYLMNEEPMHEHNFAVAVDGLWLHCTNTAYLCLKRAELLP